ncbi:EAL domain-containing protein [Halomonas campisalis]|uniref:EAL domain-containing protein n=1 Tax=Billgrantia campisalis TaxID=74661 RepID=A0ABS9PB38_9GAMM|nr:EAL domain-containing protein [Halomonas campisalis]MCG6658477.1 EAL domain-containing protein [Halomonas campisalis]MDR5863337.1 EAL domain-containing protein [Halomonas campisalis]
MTHDTSAAKRRRLSLTWRVIALSSLLLLGVAGLFTYLGHDNLTRQFQQSRDDHHARQIREIRLALSRSEESLRQLAGVVASSPGLGPAMVERDRDAILAALASQWPTLQLEAGIDEILTFDAQGHQLAGRGERHPGNDRPMEDWLNRVMTSDMPLTALRCIDTCRQYAAVPVLGEGESLGMVSLSRSLADVTRQLHQVSDGMVALLITGPRAASPSQQRHLAAWNGDLVALTHEEESLPILQRAARLSSLAPLEERPLQLSHAERHFELSAVRLAEDSEHLHTGHFLLVSDITAQIQAIERDTRTLLLAGLGGWLAAELMLLAILLGPMARLRRLAAALPSLALGGFADTRARIPHPRHRLADEIDVLEGTTLELADRLEALDREVHHRGELLASRVRELGQERDFVSSLLDTARVFILAQDERGRLALVNEHTLGVLGVREEALLGRHFDDVFPLEPRQARLPGQQHEERTLELGPGCARTIVWYHAPLSTASDASLARISVGLDITERKAAETRLTWLAQRDPLTELYNRRYFQEALDKALVREGGGALLFLDLDQFKDVNELSGHNAGDRLLRMVADALHQELGHRGVIARLGGDEFAMLIEGADERRAVRTAQHIEHLLDTLEFRSNGRRHRANASIGIALYPIHGETPTELMASVDVAMYKAKASSVQRWHLLSTVEQARVELKERVYWVERIRKALREDAFELMVQPIVRLADRDIRHYEVLLRMREDDGTLLSPGRFIPIAERNGQILQLDRWVIRHSLRLLAAVQQRGISLAVNLSGQSLHDAGLNRFLADELAASGADPRQLILEVTETAAVTDFSTARGVLQGMRELGCRTAIDDFGVGFSSFHYLGQLPVDYIKIDGSFIRTLTTSADSRVIVKAMADIAAGFGKQAIAEFVDQKALIPLLESYGIAYGQGFHLGKPIPHSEAFGMISLGS